MKVTTNLLKIREAYEFLTGSQLPGKMPYEDALKKVLLSGDLEAFAILYPDLTKKELAKAIELARKGMRKI